VDIRTIAPLAVAFLGTFFVIGLPYWSIPLDRLALPRDIWGHGLVAAAALAVGACVLGNSRAWAAGLAVGTAVPAAVFARVIYDVARDSTTHNLWPFEIVLALGPGLLAGLAGAIAGALMVRWRGA
jgi:hypothetical protein